MAFRVGFVFLIRKTEFKSFSHNRFFDPKRGSFGNVWSKKNNAYITFGQLQNNFQIVKKTNFLDPKMVKMALLEGQNLTLGPFNFGSHVSTFRAENTRKR